MSRYDPWPERFWMKVNFDGPIPAHAPHLGQCHLWTASTDRYGYGQIRFDGSLQAAHRVAVMLAGRDAPPELDADHLCRTPLCVRAEHLEMVPRQVNVLRGTAPSALSNVANICQRGLHEFTEENTVRDSPGRRKCRACRDIRMKAWRDAKRDNGKVEHVAS